MPASKKLRPPVPDDVWHIHESEIRELYHNRTVKELKQFMEDERGFPKMA